MTPIQTQRERVLAEAVVSAYLNELSAPARERQSARPARERSLERVMCLRRSRSRRRPETARAATQRSSLASSVAVSQVA
jgi:hypothetical protein